ncbi:MAG: NAD(P)/FAD-dependent oxidoreductase [Clostridia bacterium]|nr:NAD(P)/FAD-dependent oxidoreductase [Clostridia bacterium]
MNQYPHLFSPMRVGTHTYKNRVIAAPIYCGTFINIPGLDYVLTNAMRERARGGCAQVTLGETAVDFVGASREPFPPIDYTNLNDPAMAKFRPLVQDIQAEGAKCLIELSHCGESVEPIPGVTCGYGPMEYVREDGMVIHGLNEEQMVMIIKHFVAAARFFQAAGMDGVMVHAGHGWLLHQFLSPRTNRREDEYGGSLENRARFPLRLFKALREAMGKDFIIEMRVSGEESMPGGMHPEETAAFCAMAAEYIDLVHVSVGTYRNPILSGEFSSLFQPHGLNADAAAVVKKAVKIPVVVVGGINSPEQAEALIASGKCDFVALARQLTADPDFARKAESGHADDINPCLRCFKCFLGPLEGVDISEMPKLFGCSVNPAEFYYELALRDTPPKRAKNVLVVGGGIAGMSAAVHAAARGHRVTLLERGARLGGLLYFADTDYYKSDLKAYKDVMARRIEKAGVEVVLNHSFTAEDIAAYKADAVVLAIGSEPVRPPIPGIENARQALDVYPDCAWVGRNAVMIGGGLVGCEVGIHLAKNGHNVTIVEMQDEAAPEGYPMHRIALLNEMEGLVTLRTGCRCQRIHKDAVEIVGQNGETERLPADTVLYALGMRARSAEAETLKTACRQAGVEVYEIGDCVRAGKVYDANRQGYELAMRL